MATTTRKRKKKMVLAAMMKAMGGIRIWMALAMTMMMEKWDAGVRTMMNLAGSP